MSSCGCCFAAAVQACQHCNQSLCERCGVAAITEERTALFAPPPGLNRFCASCFVRLFRPQECAGFKTCNRCWHTVLYAIATWL